MSSNEAAVQLGMMDSDKLDVITTPNDIDKTEESKIVEIAATEDNSQPDAITLGTFGLPSIIVGNPSLETGPEEDSKDTPKSLEVKVIETGGKVGMSETSEVEMQTDQKAGGKESRSLSDEHGQSKEPENVTSATAEEVEDVKSARKEGGETTEQGDTGQQGSQEKVTTKKLG